MGDGKSLEGYKHILIMLFKYVISLSTLLLIIGCCGANKLRDKYSGLISIDILSINCVICLSSVIGIITFLFLSVYSKLSKIPLIPSIGNKSITLKVNNSEILLLDKSITLLSSSLSSLIFCSIIVYKSSNFGTIFVLSNILTPSLVYN